jgi:class 3 adenylate cyclase/TolB-like protein
MSSASGEGAAPGSGDRLVWQRRALLIVDLVESVRLIRRDEAGVVGRWCALVEDTRTHVLPAHGGRLVKSLGDGMLLDFPSVRQATAAAFDLLARMPRFNEVVDPALRMHLRLGCHVAAVAVTDVDLFGDGPNLAQRLCALAGPGQLVASAAACDELLDGVDGLLQDMGECYVKHYDEPVRAYRVRPLDTAGLWTADPLAGVDLRPGIAVVPFQALDPGAAAVGELLTDGINLQLGAAKHLRVVSRLSATRCRGGDLSLEQIGRQLGVQYLMEGSLRGTGDRLVLHWRLHALDRGEQLEAGEQCCALAELLQPDSPTVAALAGAVHDSLFRAEAARVRTRPLPQLDSYALLLGGIQLLHRAARSDFERSHQVLCHLAELHPRAPEPRLWLAKWYALRAVQGLTIDRAGDARRALDCTARALDADPDSAFGLAMEGFVHCHLTHDHERAEQRLDAALMRNPSETFGHLFRAVILGLRGEFHAGVQAAGQALATSPLDPARYLFDSIAAYLHLGTGEWDRAVALARSSLRRNCLHAHTWRALTIGLVEQGDLEEARRCVPHLMDVQPGLSLHSYLAGGRPDDPVRARFAEALGRAGVPVH